MHFLKLCTYSPRYTYGPAGRRTRSRRHALLLARATQHDLKCDCAGIDPADRRTREGRPGSRRGHALSWPARARAPAMSDSVLVACVCAGSWIDPSRRRISDHVVVAGARRVQAGARACAGQLAHIPYPQYVDDGQLALGVALVMGSARCFLQRRPWVSTMELRDSRGELGLYRAFYTHTKPPASRAEPNRDRRMAGDVSFQRSYVRRSRSS